MVGSQEMHWSAAEQRTSWCRTRSRGRTSLPAQGTHMAFEMKSCSKCGRVNKARKSFALWINSLLLRMRSFQGCCCGAGLLLGKWFFPNWGGCHVIIPWLYLSLSGCSSKLWLQPNLLPSEQQGLNGPYHSNDLTSNWNDLIILTTD